VTLDGVKAGGGKLTVLLYERAEGFPKEARASQRFVLPHGKTTLAIDGLKPGQYAVMAYHDEDGNGELNRLFGMIPQEGWGMSNNPKINGKPVFTDAAVALAEPGSAVTIHINY
jgi:uncharacterized protein (DUF2141 family)